MCCSRQQTASLGLLVAGSIAVATGHQALAVETGPPHGATVVHANGSVVLANRTNPPIRCVFGLPSRSPERQWLEEGPLPICHTMWEKDGIRYTQIVLMTRLGDGSLPPAGPLADDAVLMVQLVGENFTNIYAEASAGLTVEIRGRQMNLELRDGLAYVAETNAASLLAAIEVSTSGIACTNGQQLRFAGSMPPGTSGSMTFKFPAAPLPAKEDLERLRDLEFGEQFQRARRFWAERKGEPAPVVFSPQLK